MTRSEAKRILSELLDQVLPGEDCYEALNILYATPPPKIDHAALRLLLKVARVAHANGWDAGQGKTAEKLESIIDRIIAAHQSQEEARG